MTKKKWKIVIAMLITLAYYLVFFTCKFIVFENISLNPSNYQLSENCIIVQGQATTGPEIRVVEGAGFLVSAVPYPHPENLNVNEIEMTGKSIFDSFLDYPDYYACDWLIFGEVTGTTDMYEICGSGTVPIFECSSVYPIMSLSDLLILEVILFAKFPLGLLGAFVLYVLPLVVMIVVVVPRKKHSE